MPSLNNFRIDGIDVRLDTSAFDRGIERIREFLNRKKEAQNERRDENSECEGRREGGVGYGGSGDGGCSGSTFRGTGTLRVHSHCYDVLQYAWNQDERIQSWGITNRDDTANERRLEQERLLVEAAQDYQDDLRCLQEDYARRVADAQMSYQERLAAPAREFDNYTWAGRTARQWMLGEWIVPKPDPEAEERANALLLEHLTEDQAWEWGRYGRFIVIGSKGNPYAVWSSGTVTGGGESFCLQPNDSIPMADACLARKLLLETDEEEFLRRANRWTDREFRWAECQ